MRRAHIVGFLIVSITLSGCPAFDWDFEGAGGSAGTGGQAGSDVGGGGGQAGSGGGGGQGGGPPPIEDCLNGKDDDGDKMSDCADDECGLYDCLPVVEEGWSLVWALERQFPEPEPEPLMKCPDGKTPITLYKNPATTSTCSMCTCSFDGATCKAPTFKCDYKDDICAGMDFQYEAATPACVNLPNVPFDAGDYASCVILADPNVAFYGVCDGGPSDKTGPPMWEKELHLCPAPSGAGAGCLAGDACVQSKPAILQEALTCIAKAGAASCPLGWPTMISAFEGGTDERGCSTCGCDTSSIKCSGGAVKIYTENNCNAADLMTTLQNVGQCISGMNILFNYGTASANFVLGTPSDGTCTQATPTGSVNPTGPQTLCCR